MQSSALPKKVSLKDIAREVGVSAALVSYVLNDKNTSRISKVVAAKIRETAQRLNYRTNEIARSLKTSRTHTIGFVLNNISNPFSAYLARVVEDEAARQQFTVFFASSDEKPNKSRRLIENFLNRQVDGLLLAPGENGAEQVEYLQQQGVPFVLIDRYFPELPTNYVALDNFAATRQAAEHLRRCGYERIGMINYKTSLFNLHERTRGLLSVLGEDNRSLHREVDNTNLQQEVVAALDDLLDQPEPVDALLLASNEITLFALIHLLKRGVRIPEQLGLITFDELVSWDIFYAPLTYIRQPLQQMAARATNILLEAISGNRQIQQVNLAGELVVQASTCAPKY